MAAHYLAEADTPGQPDITADAMAITSDEFLPRPSVLACVFRDMLNKLHIATYNIHKGFSHFKRRMVVHQLRDSLRALNADIIFLQEVVGAS